MSNGLSGNLERLRSSSAGPVAASESVAEYRNQALMFLKPELTASHDVLALAIEIVAGVLDKYGVVINSVRSLSGADLGTSGAMRAHYGIINRIATGGEAEMSADGKAAFANYLDANNIPAGNTAGSFEFADRFPGGAETLGDFAAQATKLAPGTYVSTVEFDGQLWAVTNAFFPRSIVRFEDPANSILCFDVVFNQPWTEFRTNVVGETDPKESAPGAIRAVLLENAGALGVDISKDKNGVHGSAGAIEGAVEVARFLGVDPVSTRYGMDLLASGVTEGAIRDQFGSGVAEIEGLFPDVENLDSDASVEPFRELLARGLDPQNGSLAR